MTRPALVSQQHSSSSPEHPLPALDELEASGCWWPRFGRQLSARRLSRTAVQTRWCNGEQAARRIAGFTHESSNAKCKTKNKNDARMVAVMWTTQGEQTACQQPSLSVRSSTRWTTWVYKALLGSVPSYLCTLLHRNQQPLHSVFQWHFFFWMLAVLGTEPGNQAFSFSAPSVGTTSNQKVKYLLISLNQFCSFLCDKEQFSITFCV